MNSRMTADLAMWAVRHAVSQRSAQGAVVHTDREGQAVPITRPRARVEAKWPHRLNGLRGCLCQPRGDGVVLLALAEERLQPPELADPRRDSRGCRHVDRTDLSPSSSLEGSRQADAHRI